MSYFELIMQYIKVQAAFNALDPTTRAALRECFKPLPPPPPPAPE